MNDYNHKYLEMALREAKKSPDPDTKVGAVLVNVNKRLGLAKVAGAGFNHFPLGLSFSWRKKDCSWLDSKYPYVLHAEEAALIDCGNLLTLASGCFLYVTLFPCHKCMRLLIMVGVTKIYYRYEKNNVETEASKKMADAAGIKYYKIKI